VGEKNINFFHVLVLDNKLGRVGLGYGLFCNERIQILPIPPSFFFGSLHGHMRRYQRSMIGHFLFFKSISLLVNVCPWFSCYKKQ